MVSRLRNGRWAEKNPSLESAEECDGNNYNKDCFIGAELMASPRECPAAAAAYGNRGSSIEPFLISVAHSPSSTDQCGIDDFQSSLCWTPRFPKMCRT